MTENSISGVLPVLPSIFTAAGEVDEVGMRNVIDFIIASGADGIVFPGLASEYEELTRDERHALTSGVSQWIDGRVPFVIGASAETAELTAEYATAGAKAQCAAAMIMTPRELDGDVPGMIAFYDKVAQSSGISIMLQNAPRPMGVGLCIEDVLKIANAVEGITYVKEETPPCGPRVAALLAENPQIKGVFGGAGGRQIIDELRRGSLGTVPACEITEIHVAMMRAFQDGDENLARDMFDASLPLLTMQAVFRWRLTKDVLLRRGLIESDFTRAAGPKLDEADREEIGVLLARLDDVLAGKLPSAGIGIAAE